MDDTGPPERGSQLKETTGKMVADTLIVVLVDHNYETVLERILGDVDEGATWLRDAYEFRKQGSRGSVFKRPISDISQYWELVRIALVKTQVCLSRYKLKCTRSPVGGREMKWRGRNGVERGVEVPKGGGDGRQAVDSDPLGIGRSA